MFHTLKFQLMLWLYCEKQRFFKRETKFMKWPLIIFWRHINWMGAMELTKFWILCVVHQPLAFKKCYLLFVNELRHIMWDIGKWNGIYNLFGFISIYSFWFSFLAIRFVIFNINLDKKSYVNKHNSYSNNFHYYKSQKISSITKCEHLIFQK